MPNKVMEEFQSNTTHWILEHLITKKIENMDSTASYKSAIYLCPSNDQLMHIFLSFFNNVEGLNKKQMDRISCSILTCSHTFKVSKHVKVARNSGNTSNSSMEIYTLP